MGGCYLANRITTKLHLHLHFPLPHYNDTVLYSKTNFYKSQPPQETGPPQNFTPSYNDVVLYFKTNFNKSQPPRFPQHLGGGAIPQTGLPQNSTFPLTIMWCYISKRSFTNVNLLNSPNSWGVVISQTGLPQNSTFPPYNDVVLHSKANFNKSQPPQFPQQKSQNIIFGWQL